MTIPDEVEERLRDYFAALLPPHAAQAVLTDVLERLPLNASPGAVFVTAHKALQERVRVHPDVEADVLVEEAGLSVSDAATVLGLRVRDVREALDAARAAAAALDRGLSRPLAPDVSGRGTGTGTIAARDQRTSRPVAPRTSRPVAPRGGGTGAPPLDQRPTRAPAPRTGGTGTPALDQDLQDLDLPPTVQGNGTDSVGGDATGTRVVVTVEEEEIDVESLETIERKRAGAVLVLVLAVAIAVAAFVVAAQGT